MTGEELGTESEQDGREMGSTSIKELALTSGLRSFYFIQNSKNENGKKRRLATTLTESSNIIGSVGKGGMSST